MRQNSSFSFFDDVGVRELVKKAYPDLQVRNKEIIRISKIFEIYGRMHFSRIVVKNMAEDIKKRIVESIGSNYFSITSDGWQKPSKYPALLRYYNNYLT